MHGLIIEGVLQCTLSFLPILLLTIGLFIHLSSPMYSYMGIKMLTLHVYVYVHGIGYKREIWVKLNSSEIFETEEAMPTKIGL